MNLGVGGIIFTNVLRVGLDRYSYAAPDVGIFYSDVGSEDTTTGEEAWNDQEWHHVVWTRESGSGGQDVNIYVDGVSIGVATTASDPDFDSATQSTIGAEYDAYELGDWWAGSLKDFIMYDTELTAAQVNLLYKGQWVGAPIHRFQFNEGAGNAEDSGQGSVTATQSNATWVNPTYTIEGDFQLDVWGSMSAPRGILDINDGFDFDNVITIKFVGVYQVNLVVYVVVNCLSMGVKILSGSTVWFSNR